MIKLKALLTGKIRTIVGSAIKSGIAKESVDRPLYLGFLGFEGDEHADSRHHGGQDGAVHHYNFDWYQFWHDEIGPRKILCQPGAFGENLATTGFDESHVAVGDVFQLGGAVIEVSQGRQPCYKLNARFDNPAMARHVQESGKTGWYYRVLQQGMVTADDELVLLERKAPQWTIARLLNILYHDVSNVSALHELHQLDCLAVSWRQIFAKRLTTKRVENWSARLYGRRSMR